MGFAESAQRNNTYQLQYKEGDKIKILPYEKKDITQLDSS
jgi:hypothetical protein